MDSPTHSFLSGEFQSSSSGERALENGWRHCSSQGWRPMKGALSSCALPLSFMQLLVCTRIHLNRWSGCPGGKVEQAGRNGRSRAWGHQGASAKLRHLNRWLLDSPAPSISHPQICFALKRLRASEVTYFNTPSLYVNVFLTLHLFFSSQEQTSSFLPLVPPSLYLWP